MKETTTVESSLEKGEAIMVHGLLEEPAASSTPIPFRFRPWIMLQFVSFVVGMSFLTVAFVILPAALLDLIVWWICRPEDVPMTTDGGGMVALAIGTVVVSYMVEIYKYRPRHWVRSNAYIAVLRK